MIRPAVIATSLLGVITAGAVVTLSHAPAHTHAKADNQICIVLAKDDAHHQTQDFCVDWGGLLKQ
jgi:hypothetical protein